MKTLHFYCGTFHLIPEDERVGLFVVSQTIETPQQMSEAGHLLLEQAIKGDDDVRVFCNNEDTFNGLRVAVSRYNDENIVENVKVTFVASDGEIHHPVMNARGGLNAWPHEMHGQMMKDLAALSRARREDTKRKVV